MRFIKIDIENWKRAKTFNHFLTEIPCTYSMCVNIDISNLMITVKEHGLKLFPVCLYGISLIVNKYKEFRMAVNEHGEVGYFDISNPCYTVFHEESESFTNMWTEYSEDFKTFYDNYNRDMKLHKENESLTSMMTVPDNVFNVSCIPWISFTGFNLNLQKGYDYLPPIFTIGKYFESEGKIMLPLAIQVHHAACDGYHTAMFVNAMNEWASSFLV